MTSAPPKRVVITDIDNTLFDWLKMWSAGFNTMLSEIALLTGIEASLVKKSIRRANQALGTSEHDRVMFYLDIMDNAVRKREIVRLTNLAARVQEAKDAATQLHPEIIPTFRQLRKAGFTIISLTESIRRYAIPRITHLGLNGQIDLLVCQELTNTGSNLSSSLGAVPADTRAVTFGIELKKPNPRLLTQICDHLGVSASEVLYVGDSLFKDVGMANAAGVAVCWAKYGRTDTSPDYEVLREVSHWGDTDIAAEITTNLRRPSPDYILESGFDELVPILGI